ncbi:MAG: hypothetical protein CM15mP12_4480 [Gammaproteobacteria bacterium]|nr:MAG: hypothetical protein CM15mP12_4480 [Gammaproteobacteria bacterium]
MIKRPVSNAKMLIGKIINNITPCKNSLSICNAIKLDVVIKKAGINKQCSAHVIETKIDNLSEFC